MQQTGFSRLEDERLVKRGNKIFGDLFRRSVHSIRQLTNNDSDAKGFYRFLQNDRVSEKDIIENMSTSCRSSCIGKHVLCIQDTSEINLSSHSGRIKRDGYIGTTNAKRDQGLGFFIHPSLVLDAYSGVPYGYSDIKVWNRSTEFKSKKERGYGKLPIEEKDSYKWIEVSKNTKEILRDVVESIIIVQDREGDIYEQFATIPDEKTDLLVRARSNRRLADGTKLFDCFLNQKPKDTYQVLVPSKNGRKERIANIEIRYKEIVITQNSTANKGLPSSVPLFLIEAKETGWDDQDMICWRLLTTISIINIEMAKLCIEWYSWRWTVEEVFKILKGEGYNIEASELEYASSVRKLTLMIMQTIIKVFLMRLAYAEPETQLSVGSCFNEEEQEFLEHQIIVLEGKTERQKNPYKTKDLKRYVWAIARLGGWKGYESKRNPGITTLWIGLRIFKAAFEGWKIHRDVSTR